MAVTQEESVIDQESVARDLRSLTELGPRFMGSDSEKRTVQKLIERLSSVPNIEVTTQEFAYLGWQLEEFPQLRFVSPETSEVEAIAFIYCGPTPPDGISGEVRLLGEHWIIGDYKWDKFAIVYDDEIVGYISGRRDGVAIPQPLAEGSRVVPHFGIGTEDARLLRAKLDAGEPVTVEGKIRCRIDPDAKAENVVGSLRSDARDDRIVVCCHLDSMYTCPGANDNASGVAATLALAEFFAKNDPGCFIDFVFFNGEEWDLAGSKALAARARSDGTLEGIKLLINLDGIAYSAEQLQIWAGPEELEQDLIATVRSMDDAEGPVTSWITPPPMGADHVPFFNLGVPSCMFTGYEMVRYHTGADVFEEHLPANVVRVAEIARRLIERLASMPIDYTSRDSMAVKAGWRAIQEERILGRDP